MDTEKIKQINNTIEEFKKDSDIQQGYVHIEFCNGIHNGSWGVITARHYSSGGCNYTDDFRNMDDLIEKLNQLKEFQDNNDLY